ncbi:MAG: SHOCT domain-containing protein [Thermoplasmata archaeon]|nr:SHOCT domain-containing protein [Thermoplasmata archaeon]
MEGAEHMGMDWWGWFGIPYMGFIMLGIWLIFLVIGILVYQDAERRGMNGILWFILVIIPWIGILALLVYLIVREGKSEAVGSTVRAKSAGALLDERYVRGEITREEYLKMKKDLGS